MARSSFSPRTNWSFTPTDLLQVKRRAPNRRDSPVFDCADLEDYIASLFDVPVDVVNRDHLKSHV
jgi:predicted nucleotidyltransferase